MKSGNKEVTRCRLTRPGGLLISVLTPQHGGGVTLIEPNGDGSAAVSLGLKGCRRRDGDPVAPRRSDN